jgi:hypothetical protein
MVKEIYDYAMMGLGSNGCFVIAAPCLNGSHDYGFPSSMGHPRSDSIWLLVYDGMHTIFGAPVVLQVPRDNNNLTWNGLISWVDHMELNYDMIILLQHILYLYFIMTICEIKNYNCTLLHVIYILTSEFTV